MHGKQPHLLRQLRIYQILGAFPLELPNFTRLSTSSLCVTAVAFMSILAHHLSPENFVCGDSLISWGLMLSTKFTIIGIPIAVTCWLANHGATFQRIISGLSSAQETLGIIEPLGIPFSIKLLTGSFFAVFAIISALKSLELPKIGWMEELQLVLHILSWPSFYALFHAYCFQFTYLIANVGQCFQNLSHRWIRDRSPATLNKERHFVRVYDHLMDLCSDINRCYDPVIISNLLCTYLSGMDLTELLLTKQFDLGDFYVVLWNILQFMLMAQMIDSCQSVLNKAEECNKALLSYIIHDKGEVYQDNPLVMIHLSSRKTLTFTACKCVNVDYRLGLSMVAAFLTYIVVLFQIESPSTTAVPPVVAPNSTNTC